MTRIASVTAVTKLNLVCYTATVFVSRFYTASLSPSPLRIRPQYGPAAALD